MIVHESQEMPLQRFVFIVSVQWRGLSAAVETLQLKMFPVHD